MEVHRLGRAGRRASGAGGCPSFKFSTPRLVPLSGVPGPSLRPALPPRSAKSARAFAVAGERGWERWAVSRAGAKEGVAFAGLPPTPSRPRECVRLLVRCARGRFNKGYDCPLGSGGQQRRRVGGRGMRTKSRCGPGEPAGEGKASGEWKEGDFPASAFSFLVR